MHIQDGPLKGLKILTPKIFRDNRGYFFESYNLRLLEELGIANRFVQDNEALSAKGVLRGLHYQRGDSAQAKLIRVVRGAIYDVAVDIRPDSTTYGRFHGVVLDDIEKKEFFIPRGFAHGYLSLKPETLVQYKCDNYYDVTAEGSILYNDPRLAIPWDEQFNGELLVSEKDIAAPPFGKHQPI